MLDRFLPQTSFASYEEFTRDFRIDVPENFNFAFDVVDEIAATDPDKVALVWCDEAGDSASFTFGEMKLYSDKAANYLRSLGIGRGDRVMLILKRRYQFWFCLLGLHKLGAVAVPATHLLSTHDIVYRCNSADIKMIITIDDEWVLHHVDEAQEESPTLQLKAIVDGHREGWLDFAQGLSEAPAEFERPSGDEASQNEDMMLIYFTSGTTGMPKMVQHDFTYPLGHILTAAYWQNVRKDGLHLTVADTGWAKAVWGKMYGQWICGAQVFVYDYEKFVPADLLRVIQDYKVKTFCAPPTIYRFLIKEDVSKYDLSGLEYCVVAGEPLNPEVFDNFLAGTNMKIMEGYGQTEMIVALATYPWLEPRPGSMGKPTPGYAVDLLDDNGESCEVGVEGEIVIRTGDTRPPGMFAGYYRDEDLTKRAWHDGIYHTGDMAWRDEDGYYWFVGRADDLIKSSGYRIGPFEVESALVEHPAVIECAITGAPDPVRGQIVKATVILAKGYTASDALVKELQDHVKRVTAPYKYPRVVEFVDELPKTISGKIRRVQIRHADGGNGH
ncbi:MAG: AMP-binding protein [Armatimonadia bacterium]